MFVSYLCGGMLWGWGIARITKTDVKTMVKACTLSWSITTFIVSASLGFSLGTITPFGNTLSIRYNYYYLLIILPVIGIVTGINGWVVIGKLGLQETKKKAGAKIGIAAALGFLAVSLFLQFGLGWEVGKPIPGKYEMLTLLNYCNVGAALAGGVTMGWVLEESRVCEYHQESVNI